MITVSLDSYKTVTSPGAWLVGAGALPQSCSAEGENAWCQPFRLPLDSTVGICAGCCTTWFVAGHMAWPQLPTQWWYLITWSYMGKPSWCNCSICHKCTYTEIGNLSLCFARTHCQAILCVVVLYRRDSFHALLCLTLHFTLHGCMDLLPVATITQTCSKKR